MKNQNKDSVCFTIGHSNYPVDEFIKLLKEYEISTIIDVRSVPYSEHVPQYNREELSQYLNKKDIDYCFKGEKLGAKREDEGLLNQEGFVDYSKIREDTDYKNEIENLIEEIEGNDRICLMCSEKDPFDCHRFVLLSYSLEKNGITVNHILEDGSTIENSDLEDRLLDYYDLDPKQTTLFGDGLSKEEAIEEGYQKRNMDIAINMKR